MAWCEQNGVYYCMGLARDDRLLQKLEQTLARARERAILCGGRAREFTEFEYQTLKSWSISRRVIAKAEVLPQGDNPRFIVTNLPKGGWGNAAQAARFQAAALYEKFYCARDEMENRIKEQKSDLFADRTSTHWLASNH
jgi:hypothetical protein